ncbi:MULTISPECIES: class F sortase [unclassified Kitasatospora]|uniref:class F sortase n=1 Tax=unclassified Kitasatospora TaxID=2633591 RepID=UPI0009E97619
MGRQTAPNGEGEIGSPAAREGGSLRPFWWAMGAAALGLLVMYQSVDTGPVAPSQVAAVAPAAAPTAGASSLAAPAVPTLPRSRPVRLWIPQLFVEAPFVELGLDRAGALEAPAKEDRNLVGWYRDGASPGERGSAVVAGHVDTTTGPAVFLMLHRLAPGNTIDITRADGIVATFAVDSVQTFPKDRFPDQQVYADTDTAQLRLITCGGAYDRQRKDYTDNVVVFAHLQSSRQT